MLKDLLESTRLDLEFCAALLRVSPEHFTRWVRGESAIPKFAATELSAILGVSEGRLQLPSRSKGQEEPPAIWYKLRDPQLAEADREIVGAIRKIGLYLSQLRSLQGQVELRHVAVFQQVRGSVDKAAPPADQGCDAAASFRRLVPAFAHGSTGIGEILRPQLRQLGVLAFESPLKGSKLEGCSFGAGRSDSMTPCLFANSYQATWFRRNGVLAHELCHGIFDLDSDQISIDYETDQWPELRERRAHVFARELLVPKAVLLHYASQWGIKWDNLTPTDLARFVASTHVEPRLLLEAAEEADLIDESLWAKYRSFDCTSILPDLSEHALNLHEYLRLRGIASPKWTSEFRRVRIGARTVTLPVGYVKEVLGAADSGLVTTSKAAEMLLMDRYTFLERFSDLLPARPE